MPTVPAVLVSGLPTPSSLSTGWHHSVMADSDTTEALTAFMHDAMPFSALIGVEPVAADKDEVRARINWDPSRCTVADVMHGGVLMSLADSTGAYCAFLNIPEGAGTT